MGLSGNAHLSREQGLVRRTGVRAVRRGVVDGRHGGWALVHERGVQMMRQVVLAVRRGKTRLVVLGWELYVSSYRPNSPWRQPQSFQTQPWSSSLQKQRRHVV